MSQLRIQVINMHQWLYRSASSRVKILSVSGCSCALNKSASGTKPPTNLAHGEDWSSKSSMAVPRHDQIRCIVCKLIDVDHWHVIPPWHGPVREILCQCNVWATSATRSDGSISERSRDLIHCITEFADIYFHQLCEVEDRMACDHISTSTPFVKLYKRPSPHLSRFHTSRIPSNSLEVFTSGQKDMLATLSF